MHMFTSASVCGRANAAIVHCTAMLCHPRSVPIARAVLRCFVGPYSACEFLFLGDPILSETSSGLCWIFPLLHLFSPTVHLILVVFILFPFFFYFPFSPLLLFFLFSRSIMAHFRYCSILLLAQGASALSSSVPRLAALYTEAEVLVWGRCVTRKTSALR